MSFLDLDFGRQIVLINNPLLLSLPQTSLIKSIRLLTNSLQFTCTYNAVIANMEVNSRLPSMEKMHLTRFVEIVMAFKLRSLFGDKL